MYNGIRNIPGELEEIRIILKASISRIWILVSSVGKIQVSKPLFIRNSSSVNDQLSSCMSSLTHDVTWSCYGGAKNLSYPSVYFFELISKLKQFCLIAFSCEIEKMNRDKVEKNRLVAEENRDKVKGKNNNEKKKLWRLSLQTRDSTRKMKRAIGAKFLFTPPLFFLSLALAYELTCENSQSFSHICKSIRGRLRGSSKTSGEWNSVEKKPD